jgi:hypothetical protein
VDGQDEPGHDGEKYVGAACSDHLSHRERSDRERSEAIRVRGYGLSIGSNPSPAAFGVDLSLWER